jgi:L-iditol 2-dehydrogenase
LEAIALTNVSKIELVNRDIPKIDDNSLLLKVKAVGICGFDLRILRNGDAKVQFPRIMGHEVVGEVRVKV